MAVDEWRIEMRRLILLVAAATSGLPAVADLGSDMLLAEAKVIPWIRGVQFESLIKENTNDLNDICFEYTSDNHIQTASACDREGPIRVEFERIRGGVRMTCYRDHPEARIEFRTIEDRKAVGSFLYFPDRSCNFTIELEGSCLPHSPEKEYEVKITARAQQVAGTIVCGEDTPPLVEDLLRILRQSNKGPVAIGAAHQDLWTDLARPKIAMLEDFPQIPVDPYVAPAEIWALDVVVTAFADIIGGPWASVFFGVGSVLTCMGWGG